MSKKLLKKFIGAFAYYQLIAKANKITNPFDYRVVEAYWTGNDLLKKVEDQDIRKMIVSKFSGAGLLNKNVAKNLIRKMPPNFVPHHSFHVFYLGSVTGIVPKNLKTFNSCYVSWGRIQEIQDKNLIVLRSNLIQKNRKLIFSKPVSQKILFRINGKSFIKNPQIGDYVSIHWDWACDKLNKRSLEKLKHWTSHNLEIINKV